MSGVKKDCTCPRACHVHGTWHAYASDRCRCQLCCRAHSTYMRLYRHRRHQSGGQTVMVPSIGAARRLQALAAVGWSSIELAARLGVDKACIPDWRHQKFASISRETHAKIDALYNRLWDQPGPSKHSTYMRRLAARRGWVPPMAWDDDEIDRPDARPASALTGARELQPCGTPAAIRRHYRRGEPLCETCKAAEGRDRQDKYRRGQRSKEAAA